jgi:hypothetical protein
MSSPNTTLWGSLLPGGASPSSVSGVTTVIVSDLIYTALRIAGVLAEPGRGPGNPELNEGGNVLNSLIDAWKIERLLVYAILRNVFDIVPSKATYSISAATDSDLVLERPSKIIQAGLIWINATPNVETPLRVLTQQEWAAYSPKDMTSTAPSYLYYETTIPTGTIYLRPIPTTANKFSIYAWQTLQTIGALSDEMMLPWGYQRALEYNLAYELAQRYPKRQKMQPSAIGIARESKAWIKSINAPDLQMRCESGLLGAGGRGRFSILTNSYLPGG